MHARIAAATGPSDQIPQADGNVLDVLLLQAHVLTAVFWLISCVLVAFLAVPALRKVPSASFLHELQVRRELVFGVLWATFVLTLGTGTYLLFQHAIYDPPFSGGDFNGLEAQPYGLPYYYALYGKIALFLLMGGASLILALEGSRAAQLSEAAGGPVEGAESDEADWLDEEVLPEGTAPVDVSDGAGGTRLATRPLPPVRSIATLWASAGVLVVGAGGVGFCVTLIKYFHELARAAVVYEQLRLR